jgi:toxin HigB-1
MIISFKHKGLERFYKTGSASGIQAAHSRRLSLFFQTLIKLNRR